MATIHFNEGGGPRCRDLPGLPVMTTDRAAVTCKRCLHALNAPVYVGTSRGRKQYELTCSGGPWADKKVVLSAQVGGPMSMWIHVGEHVGRYNMNTGVWTPKGKTE